MNSHINNILYIYIYIYIYNIIYKDIHTRHQNSDAGNGMRLASQITIAAKKAR